MTDLSTQPPADASWRLFDPADMPFVYHLVTKVDPRWWRFSRHGLEPSKLLQTAQGIAAGVIIVDGFGSPVACALLADAGSSGTGALEFFALPDPQSEALARRFASELIDAAFKGAPIRQLYYERFENDADVLGEVADLFEVEVTYPDFAMIDGAFENRTIAMLTAKDFKAWKRGNAE